MTFNIINDSISCLTAEGQAAVQLKDMLTASIPEEIEGQINIASNIKYLYINLWLINIDIVVWGEFSNCILPHYYSLEDKGPKKDLVVKDFLILFDLKSHQADRVSCKDSQILVKYSNKTQNISHRIDLQRDHLVAALNSEHTNVIASDAIWLNSVTKEELSKITSGQNVNALPNEFEFKDLIDTILAQGVKPTYDEVNDCYILSAGISDEFKSEMTSLLQDMGLYDVGYSDNEYDASYEEYEKECEKQRYTEAEAKARDYFYNKKERIPRYLSGGWLEGFPDCPNVHAIPISDEELAEIKKIVVSDVLSNEGSSKSELTYEEALKKVSFDKIYKRNSQLHDLLYLDCMTTLEGSDGMGDMTDYHVPSDIILDTCRYYYRFAYVAFDSEECINPIHRSVDISLTDEEYIELLTLYLLSDSFMYTFNQLLQDDQELACKINENIGCKLPHNKVLTYSIFLDEVKEDVKAIHGIDPTVSAEDLPF